MSSPPGGDAKPYHLYREYGSVFVPPPNGPSLLAFLLARGVGAVLDAGCVIELGTGEDLDRVEALLAEWEKTLPA